MADEEDKAGSISIWVFVCLVFYILVHVRMDGNTCVLGSIHVLRKDSIFSIHLLSTAGSIQ